MNCANDEMLKKRSVHDRHKNWDSGNKDGSVKARYNSSRSNFVNGQDRSSSGNDRKYHGGDRLGGGKFNDKKVSDLNNSDKHKEKFLHNKKGFRNFENVVQTCPMGKSGENDKFSLKENLEVGDIKGSGNYNSIHSSMNVPLKKRGKDRNYKKNHAEVCDDGGNRSISATTKAQNVDFQQPDMNEVEISD